MASTTICAGTLARPGLARGTASRGRAPASAPARAKSAAMSGLSGAAPAFFGAKPAKLGAGIASAAPPGRARGGGAGSRSVATMGLFGLGLPELVVIGGVAAVLFGPSKLPELGKSLGKTVKSFQAAANVRSRRRERPNPPRSRSHRHAPAPGVCPGKKRKPPSPGDDPRAFNDPARLYLRERILGMNIHAPTEKVLLPSPFPPFDDRRSFRRSSRKARTRRATRRPSRSKTAKRRRRSDDLRARRVARRPRRGVERRRLCARLDVLSKTIK